MARNGANDYGSVPPFYPPVPKAREFIGSQRTLPFLVALGKHREVFEHEGFTLREVEVASAGLLLLESLHGRRLWH